MAGVMKRTPLEDYVKDYLKSHRTKSKADFNLLRKAAVYIEQKIVANNCDVHPTVLNLFTREENMFVRTVWRILIGMSRFRNVQSLKRTLDAINNYITPTCCFENDTIFILTGPEGDLETITNPYLIDATASVGGPFRSDITHIDFYLDGVLNSVSIMNPASVLVDIENIGINLHSYWWIAYTESGKQVRSRTVSFILINP